MNTEQPTKIDEILASYKRHIRAEVIDIVTDKNEL
jgi:hypothetical protein